MSRVIIFSRTFPGYHPHKGEPTYFVEKFWKGLETGNRRDGEYSIWTKHPRLMKAGHWQIPHLWRDDMIDKSFKPKFHTIRAGNRWKEGDWFSPRIWSGKPYRSKQIIIGPDIEVKKTWDIRFCKEGKGFIIKIKHKPNLSQLVKWADIAANDGLSLEDFKNWFPCEFAGQIICWNEHINY